MLHRRLPYEEETEAADFHWERSCDFLQLEERDWDNSAYLDPVLTFADSSLFQASFRCQCGHSGTGLVWRLAEEWEPSLN